MVALAIFRSRSYTLGVLKLVAVNQMHNHHLHAIRRQKATGTDVYTVAKWHHLISYGYHLGMREIALLTHTQKAVRIKGGCIWSPKVRIPADEFVREGDISPTHEM